MNSRSCGLEYVVRRGCGARLWQAAKTAIRWTACIVVRLATRMLHKIVKPSRRLVVFASAFGYCGNCRTLYEALATDPEYDCRWISMERSDPHGTWRYSPSAVWTILRAGALVVDNYLYSVLPHMYVARDKLVFQTWHGVGIKRLGRYEKRPQREIVRILRDASRYDVFIATSPLMRQHFAESFDIPVDRVQIVGYPRNDVFARSHSVRKRVRQVLEARVGCPFRHLIFYAPTWREGNRIVPAFAAGHLEHLAGQLAVYDAILVTKWHPITRDRHPALESHSGRLFSYDRVWDGEVEELLCATDVLVTDYSSIAYDFVLLDRPIVFTMADADEYAQYRGFIPGAQDLLPGPVVNDYAGLIDRLNAFLLEGCDDWRQQRQHVCKQFHSFTDGRSTARCLELLREALESGAGVGDCSR